MNNLAKNLVGVVTVDASTSLVSAAVRRRSNLCCLDHGSCDPCGACRHFSRLDLLLGYRYLRLKDSLLIREDLSSVDEENYGDFDIFDQFDTRNSFHGGEIGVSWEAQRHRWSLEVLAGLALGAVSQDVDISGGTTISNRPDGATDEGSYSGGLLAQRTNSGLHSQSQFAVVPELGVTLGWQLTERLRTTFGYTFLYFSRVVRPGGQIDLDVNPDLLAPELVPFTGPLRLRFAFQETDYWAQGFSIGLDYYW